MIPELIGGENIDLRMGLMSLSVLTRWVKAMSPFWTLEVFLDDAEGL